MSSETVLVEPRLRQPSHARDRRIESGLAALMAVAVVVGLMAMGYHWSGRSATVLVNGQPTPVRTHQLTVGALLEDMGLVLWPEDIVQPALDTPLRDTLQISIRRARPVTLIVDGRRILHRTQAPSPANVLVEAGVTLGPYDRITVNGWNWVPERPFGVAGPVEIQVHRAVPFTLNDDGLIARLWTTAPTLGQALAEQGIRVYLADVVSVPLDTPMRPGLNVTIQRSLPVTLFVDSQEIRTRTRAKTVAGVLDQEGIKLRKLDYTVPAGDTPLTYHLLIDVRRVDEKFVYEERAVPFETVWQADPNLEIDQRRVIQAGQPGVRKRRTRIVYENGEEVSREITNWWVEKEPMPEIVAYGTNLVWRTVNTPEGPKRYWRKIRVLATSYSAATSGKPRDHPAYGITRLGWKARKGVVAVDPKVINLRQTMYVPGYGIGVAGDTGGRITGRHIDLAFDEGDLQLWYRWVDVYLLEPAPPTNRISYILPDWPRER